MYIINKHVYRLPFIINKYNFNVEFFTQRKKTSSQHTMMTNTSFVNFAFFLKATEQL